jgi:nicotinamidase-related amidase
MKVNGGKAIVPNVIKAVDIARQRGILVVWVGTGYPFFLARFLFLPHTQFFFFSLFPF